MYIDKVVVEKIFILEILICEFYVIIVEQFMEEGDRIFGVYCEGSVVIVVLEYLLFDVVQVFVYMEELVGFINKDDLLKYDLMKVVLVYYWFGWIYLFRNGNG